MVVSFQVRNLRGKTLVSGRKTCSLTPKLPWRHLGSIGMFDFANFRQCEIEISRSWEHRTGGKLSHGKLKTSTKRIVVEYRWIKFGRHFLRKKWGYLLFDIWIMCIFHLDHFWNFEIIFHFDHSWNFEDFEVFEHFKGCIMSRWDVNVSIFPWSSFLAKWQNEWKPDFCQWSSPRLFGEQLLLSLGQGICRLLTYESWEFIWRKNVKTVN